MGDKKNIDNFFQEHFKEFNENPPENAWENIQSELDKQDSDNKKIIPMWFKLSGIAASIVFFVTFLVFQLSSDNNTINEVVEAPNNIGKTILIDKNKQEAEVNTNISFKEITGSDLESSKTKEFSVASTSNTTPNNNGVSKSVLKKYNTNLNQVSKNKLEENSSIYKNVAIENNSANVAENNEAKEKNNKVNKVLPGDNLMKEKVIHEQLLVNEEIDNNKKTSDYLLVKSEENRSKEAQKVLVDRAKNTESEITPLNNQQEEESVVAMSNLSKTDKSLTGELTNKIVNKNNHIGNIKKDSLELVVENTSVKRDNEVIEEEKVEEDLPVEKTIEEAIAEQETEDEKEENNSEIVEFRKWNISPNIAPVYYNSLASGSPIDGDLAANKKKGQFTTSYGISVGYALNKKISVRAGINKLEVGYDTEGVALYLSNETTGVKGLKNVTMSSPTSSMSIASATTYSASQIPESFSLLFDSSLNQRLGYIEVPVELSYKLSDKKFKVDVIAGMSSFFLNKNEIYSENNSVVTYIGEANNLNNTVYSTNIGFGFEYNISKGVNFNFEPMFKYQLNAFSNDSGNFKPYILGLYTGFSYKF